MRKINVSQIRDTVRDLAIEANIFLRKDILLALEKSLINEKNKVARKILEALIKNAYIAKIKKIPVCQDTGIPVVFVEIGEQVKIAGGTLKEAIYNGINDGYRCGYLRNSIVKDPISRKSLPSSIPPVIYFDLVKGDKIKITVAPKGFGSENTSRIKMLKPTEGVDKIIEFVVETVKNAGANACPPFVVGVGIGGTFDKAALLSKEALLRPITRSNPDKETAQLEKKLLSDINKLGIGPMGLGGMTTALGVNVLTYPTHIAGLPVAVNIGCHVTRSASRII